MPQDASFAPLLAFSPLLLIDLPFSAPSMSREGTGDERKERMRKPNAAIFRSSVRLCTSLDNTLHAAPAHRHTHVCTPLCTQPQHAREGRQKRH
eukprot:2702615-Rhodomonas_salina.4